MLKTYNPYNSIELLQFSNLTDQNDITHCITTRYGGTSVQLYESLNLSFNVEDNPEAVQKNREKIASVIGIPTQKLFVPRQCHTRNVRIVGENTSINELTETDALITDKSGHALAILAADCVPILLYDPICRIIAAIHAGWKGTILNIVSSTLESMEQNFNCMPENIMAAIGPCISVEKYEVDEDVASEFRKLFNKDLQIIVPGKKTGKSNINLKEANRQLLIGKGVKSENIEISEYCTYSHPEMFFSARRDGIRCGRFASIIMLK